MNLKIGSIGFDHWQVQGIDYLSTKSLLDFDHLIINSNTILERTTQGRSEEILKWKNKFEEFIKIKNVPIIFFNPINRHTYNITANRLADLAPVPLLDVENESGNSTRILPGTPFTEFLSKYHKLIQYNSFFTVAKGNTIIETFHHKKVIGFYNKSCVFLPSFHIDVNDDEFLEDLVKAAKNSVCADSVTFFPQWAENFFLPEERKILNKTDDIIEKIKRLNNALEEQKKQSDLLQRKKLLFTSSGNELVEQVQLILEDLGVQILETESGRDDLIVQFEDKVAVIEVKGVTKSAAEKHAAQLEKWASTYLENYGKVAKPILVVNPFRDTPLDERIEMAFPDQMIPYSKQRNHCLISTLQLLGLYYEVKKTPGQKAKLINGIFNTIGVYDGFLNWEDYIELNSE